MSIQEKMSGIQQLSLRKKQQFLSAPLSPFEAELLMALWTLIDVQAQISKDTDYLTSNLHRVGEGV